MHEIRGHEQLGHTELSCAIISLIKACRRYTFYVYYGKLGYGILLFVMGHPEYTSPFWNNLNKGIDGKYPSKKLESTW